MEDGKMVIPTEPGQVWLRRHSDSVGVIWLRCHSDSAWCCRERKALNNSVNIMNFLTAMEYSRRKIALKRKVTQSFPQSNAKKNKYCE